MASAYEIPVPRQSPALFRVVEPPAPFSCRGVAPANVFVQPQVLARSGVSVSIYGVAWFVDPRGDCGECPACRAKLMQDGAIWAAMYAVED